MSASREQGPRLRPLAYEPTPTEPTTECPPCGAQIDRPRRLLRVGTGWSGPRCRW
jgi:hypothetical protein